MSDDEEQRQRIAKANAMRNLSRVDRDELIKAAPNCIDARQAFEFRARQVGLSRSYSRPGKPKGIA